jgi:hypothetical protein
MNREERQVAVSPVLAGSENFGIDLMRKGVVSLLPPCCGSGLSYNQI